MSREQEDLKYHAELLRTMLQDKRKEVEELEGRWKEANRKARDWVAGEKCQARSFVDGWLCCLQNDHENEHETAGGYKFVRTR